MKGVGFILSETKEVELLVAKMGPHCTLLFRSASLGVNIVTRLRTLIKIYVKQVLENYQGCSLLL